MNKLDHIKIEDFDMTKVTMNKDKRQVRGFQEFTVHLINKGLAFKIREVKNYNRWKPKSPIDKQTKHKNLQFAET